MVSTQLDISVTDAILRLRSYAFATETPLTEIAQDVVDRRLRFAEPPAPRRAVDPDENRYGRM